MYTCSWIWISAETTFTFTQGPVIFAGHEDAIWWTTKLPGPTVLELPFSYSSLASSALFFSFSSSFLHTFFFLRPSIATGESKSIHQRSSIRRCLPAVYEPLYLSPPKSMVANRNKIRPVYTLIHTRIRRDNNNRDNLEDEIASGLVQ